MEKGLPRKLAVLLHADVVGSTGLVQLNEALAHERIQDTFRRFSETIASHGGIAHELRGDALVAEFAKVSDAVSASLAFQAAHATHNEELPDEVRPVVRVGIAMGEVVVADNTVTGEGVVLAQRLEQLAGAGGVCIQDAAYQTVPKRLPFEYEYLGEQKLKGFDEPVRAYGVSLTPGKDVPTPQFSESETPEPKLPDTPSIAVLPFTNMSGDLEQEYFSDGITEDIITELSRFPTLFVIARHSTFSFKGQAIKIEEVGRQLGVKYVVEGSVRKAGNRIRVTAQLIETLTSNHVWAERYDRELEDIFAVQDEVTQAIVSSLSDRLEASDAERAKYKATHSMTAYDHLLQGREHWHRLTRDDMSAARLMYRKAIDLDPHYARAHALLAATHIWDKFMGWSDSGEGLEEAKVLAEKALALDERDGSSHAMLGFICFFDGQDDKAEAHFERALSLNPNDADVAAFWSDVLVYLGRTEEALGFISKARQLNPFPPDWYHWFFALISFSGRRYEEAIGAINQIRTLDRWHKAYRAACLAQLGRSPEALNEVQEFVTMREKELATLGQPLPTNRLDLAQDRADRYRLNTDREHFIESLRMAGLSK
jgi:TolB-like protein/class 3 adenylate cyclase/Tfp pilus assembly protein PilF